MLENTIYFLPLTALAFTIIFAISGRVRLNTLHELLFNKSVCNSLKWLTTSFNISLFILALGFLLTIISKCSGQEVPIFFLTPLLTRPVLIAAGYFIIKFSVAWLIITEHEMHKFIEQKREVLTIKHMKRIELISHVSLFLFIFGIALVFLNLALIALLLLTITHFVIFTLQALLKK